MPLLLPTLTPVPLTPFLTPFNLFQPSENSIPDALYEDDSPLSSTGTLDRNSLNSNPPPLSPYAVKPSKGSIVRPNKQGKMPPPVASKPATLKRVTITIAQTQGEVREELKLSEHCTVPLQCDN